MITFCDRAKTFRKCLEVVYFNHCTNNCMFITYIMCQLKSYTVTEERGCNEVDFLCYFSKQHKESLKKNLNVSNFYKIAFVNISNTSEWFHRFEFPRKLSRLKFKHLIGFSLNGYSGLFTRVHWIFLLFSRA